MGDDQITFLGKSLLGLDQGIKDGKRESEIASLALQLPYHRLLLADVVLAFVKAAFG
ncbi:hypothetical protein IVA97_37265 [Bradyrhizobium sp. 15]|nr:hypothetical protein [Bradyrhizobium sp. 15]